MKIALLSNIKGVMLDRYLNELLTAGVVIDSIILDSKEQSNADIERFEFRTGGKLESRNLYSFETNMIPCFFVENHNNLICTGLVWSRNIDLLVNAGTPRILTSGILEAPNKGVLSCHPGGLPQFRGSCPVEWAIYNDKELFNTVYFMTEEVDCGPIVLKEPVDVRGMKTYQDIRTEVLKQNCILLAKGVRKVIEKDLHPVHMSLPQSKGMFFNPMKDTDLDKIIKQVRERQYVYQWFEHE